MNQREDVYKIPKRVNDPIMFAWFEINHIMVVLFALGLGMVFNYAMELFVASIVYLKLAALLAEKYPKSRLKHILIYYGILPVSPKNKTTPDPMKKEWFK